jgi:hypothetical protein
MEGGCTCRQIRYRLTATPPIVHACHCRWCQRETGTANALNALYEADRRSTSSTFDESFRNTLARTHVSLGKDAPCRRPIEQFKTFRAPRRPAR